MGSLFRWLVKPPASKQRAGTAPRSPAPLDGEWPRRRAPVQEADLRLSAVASDWLATLPRRICPRHLADEFPRIVNRLAICWSDPLLTELVMEGLLIDKRGGRRGFPPAVSAELVRLHEFHERRLTAAEKSAPSPARSAWTEPQATVDR